MHIDGFILRCKDRHLTACFYSHLKLSTREHQHGGPQHFEIGPLAPDLVVELYSASERFARDAVMVQVDSLERTIASLREIGAAPKSDITERTGFRFFYVADPDGRDVMVVQKP